MDGRRLVSLGACRELNMPYIYDQEPRARAMSNGRTSNTMITGPYLQAGFGGELAASWALKGRIWSKLLESFRPTDSWCSSQDGQDSRRAAAESSDHVVNSLGTRRHLRRDGVYKAIKATDTGNDTVFLAMGPLHHGQELGDGSSLGALTFGSDTGLYFARDSGALPGAIFEGRRTEARSCVAGVGGEPGTNTCGACPRGLWLRQRLHVKRRALSQLFFGAKARLHRTRSERSAIRRIRAPTPQTRSVSGRPSHLPASQQTCRGPTGCVDDQRGVSGRPERHGVLGHVAPDENSEASPSPIARFHQPADSDGSSS